MGRAGSRGQTIGDRDVGRPLHLGGQRTYRLGIGIVAAEALEQAREFNSKRYHFQGIGRYEPAAAYDRGLADLRALASLLPAEGFLFGARPSSIDASIYGFTASIYYYEINTPLRKFIAAQPNIVRHCASVHAAVQG